MHKQKPYMRVCVCIYVVYTYIKGIWASARTAVLGRIHLESPRRQKTVFIYYTIYGWFFLFHSLIGYTQKMFKSNNVSCLSLFLSLSLYGVAQDDVYSFNVWKDLHFHIIIFIYILFDFSFFYILISFRSS